MRQIRLAPDGLWHRTARGDPHHTACGMKIEGRPVASRDHAGEDNHLCPVCWTSHEMDTGEMKRLEREHTDADDEPTDPGSK